MMPSWGKLINLCLHPMEMEHYAVGSIREHSQRSFNRECVGAVVDTTYWKAVVVGIKAGEFFDTYKQAQCLKVQIVSKGEHFEANVSRPLKSDLHKELFPNLVLQLPLTTAMFNIDITIITCGGQKPVGPIIFKFDVKTYGYRPGTPEKDRYTTLSYPPSLLLPDASGRVELWKRWAAPKQKVVPLPLTRHLDMAKSSTDPRTNGSAVQPTSSKPVIKPTSAFTPLSKDVKRKRDFSSDGSDHEEPRVVDLTTAVLSKKARKRLDQGTQISKAATVPPSPAGVGGPVQDKLTFLQSVNDMMQRELQCLKEYEKNRMLKDEVDKLRSQLGLPPGDPLGLEAQMASMGFSTSSSNVTSPNHSHQALTPQLQPADLEMAGDQIDSRRSSRRRRQHGSEADSDRWPHDKWTWSGGQDEQATVVQGSPAEDDVIFLSASEGASSKGKRQPMISADRLKMLAERANEPHEQAGVGHEASGVGWQGCPGTGANSAGFAGAGGAQSPSTPRSQRRWGGPKRPEDASSEDAAVREQREITVERFVAQMEKLQASQSEPLEEGQVQSTGEPFSPRSIEPHGAPGTTASTEELGTRPSAPSVGQSRLGPSLENGESTVAIVKPSGAEDAEADAVSASPCATPPPRHVEPIEIIEIEDSPGAETLGKQECGVVEVNGEGNIASVEGEKATETVVTTPYACTNPYVSPISVRNQDQDHGVLSEADSPLARRGISARRNTILAAEGANPYQSPVSVRKSDEESVAAPAGSPLGHRTASARPASMVSVAFVEEASSMGDTAMSADHRGDDLANGENGTADFTEMESSYYDAQEEENVPASTPSRMEDIDEEDEHFGELAVVDFATTPPTRKRSSGRSARKPTMRDDIGSWD